MRKKIISLAMALAMVLSLLPGAAMAAEVTSPEVRIANPNLDVYTTYNPADYSNGAWDANPTISATAGDANTINVTVTVANLQQHKGGADGQTDGYWLGIAIPQVSGATYYQSWSEITDTSSNGVGPDGTTEYNGKTWDGVYWNLANKTTGDKGYLAVKVSDTVTTYVITFNFTLKADPVEPTDPAITVDQNSMKPVLANFNVALTGENLPYTGTPALGEVTYAAAADSAPATFSVSPTVANLKAHPTTGTDTTNPDLVKPWVGIGVPQPAAGVTVKYYAGWAEPACTGEGDQPDNTQTVDTTTYDTFYWGVTEAHKTANDKGYLAAVYSADNKADVKVLYVLDFKNVSLYTEPEPVSVTATFAKLTDGNYYGKTPSDLGTFDVAQDAQTGKTVTVTGSAKYITEWTAFSSIVDEQAGHYLPINIALTAGQDSYETVTITGSKTKTIDLTKDDPTLQLIMRLDDLTSGTFTVKYGADDVYTVDVSGVVLLPNSTTTADKVEVTVDEKEAESLGNLIKDDNVTTDANAPVKVEDAGGDKTLTFTGKDGTGAEVKDTTAVTLPKALVDVVTAGDTKADVKVESKNGSVTIPSANLTSVTNPTATVEITVAKATTTDVADVAVDNANATDTEKAAIQSALTTAAASGVTVTATSNDANLIANVSEANAVTVVITGLDSGKTYVLLCVSGEDAKTVTSYGEYTGTTAITVKSKHLTTFVPVEKTDANKDALAKVPADSGKVSTVAVNYTRYTSADEGYKQWFSGKLELTGLTANNYYVIQLGSPNGANRVYQVQQADATGKITLIAQAGAKLWVFEAGASNTNLAAGVAAGPVLGGADGYTLPTA